MPRTSGLTALTLHQLLDKHQTKLRSSLKWQTKAASSTSVYVPPPESVKVALPKWTAQQQDDLAKAFVSACEWFEKGEHQTPVLLGPASYPTGLTDEPVNVNPNVADDTVTASQAISPAYMWKLYVAHVAFSLAAEYTHQLAWSIGDYTPEELRYLFDSTTMAWNYFGSYYEMGTYAAYVPVLRADNLPKTAFAPPMWTYSFLKSSRLIGTTRKDTICRILDWMRHNLTHFYGNDSFGNYYAVWQYRGYPPLSRIICGTVDTNNPSLGSAHYTAGCHGSVGFLNAVLRVLNIPVQPVWVCGHELACFMTEKLYLDHGDDPYHLNVKSSSQSISNVLIEEATYKSRFTADVSVNITDPQSPAAANIGLAAAQFPNP